MLEDIKVTGAPSHLPLSLFIAQLWAPLKALRRGERLLLPDCLPGPHAAATRPARPNCGCAAAAIAGLSSAQPARKARR
jgi:hypothetical protein